MHPDFGQYYEAREPGRRERADVVINVVLNVVLKSGLGRLVLLLLALAPLLAARADEPVVRADSRRFAVDGTPATVVAIRPGDTLFGIARTLGVPVSRLVEMNGVADPSRIRAGDTLFVPSDAGIPPDRRPAEAAESAQPSSAAAQTPAAPSGGAAASNACDRLCLDLLADAAAARRNVVFSPFSLSGALGMAALGAKGETLAQIDRIAGTGLDPDALAEREAGVRDAILKAARADGVELQLADSLWKQKGDAPLPGFERALRRGFGAEVLDFGPFPASAVNRWVSKKTKGLLPSVFDDLPAGTRLALVDAVYFKARWAVPFERKRTSDRTFYPEGGAPKTVPFMNLLAWFAYDSSDRWESLEIPYRGNRFRMQIVPPQARPTGMGRAAGPPISNSPSRSFRSAPRRTSPARCTGSARPMRSTRPGPTSPGCSRRRASPSS